jgi:hypothetical protein
MANPCAALDPTWAHLPAPAPTHVAASHYRLFPAAAFENEALTAALRASMAPAHTAGAAGNSFSPATPSSSTSSASELLSSGHDAPAPPSGPAAAAGCRPPARALKGPKGGRVSKRKPRPSRRSQTTYITADPADFRRMVQEITGLPVPVPVPGSASSPPAASGAATAAGAPRWTPAPVLPTLDTSAFLLDGATAVPEYKCSSGSAPAAAASAGDHDYSSSLLLEMEAMIDFPTLESWGIIG